RGRRVRRRSGGSLYLVDRVRPVAPSPRLSRPCHRPSAPRRAVADGRDRSPRSSAPPHAAACLGMGMIPGCNGSALTAFSTAVWCRTCAVPSTVTSSASPGWAMPGVVSTSKNPCSSSSTSDEPSAAATRPASLSCRPCSASRRARREVEGHKVKQDNTYGEEQQPLSAPLAQEPADPDLARLCPAWPTLPGHLEAATLALMQTGR